jgi:hypothetical protein
MTVQPWKEVWLRQFDHEIAEIFSTETLGSLWTTQRSNPE